MKDTSLYSAGMTFPARLVLGADQFFKTMRYHSELSGLAYRVAYSDGVKQGLQGRDLAAYVERASKIHSDDPTVQANAFSVVVNESWTSSSRSESQTTVALVRELTGLEARKFAGLEQKLRSASRWHSVSEIPNFPFTTFAEMLNAIAAGRCYISVCSLGFRRTNLTSGRAQQAWGGFLSWVPFLVVLASIVGATAWRNGWMLIGIPAAALGMIQGASPVTLFRPILLVTRRDPAIPLIFRLAANVLLVLTSEFVGAILPPLLFGWMLFTNRAAAAWVVASYMLSIYAIRVFRARGTIALRAAAEKSETFFLFALSDGDCALRDSTTGQFLRPPERPG
jgi:hypothetical protein